MNHALGMMIESLVAVLLLVTIGYCAILNSRLKRLRADERALQNVIGELVSASERAERAIAALKQTAQDCDQTLGERLRAAERMTVALERQIGAGERTLDGLSGTRDGARPTAGHPARHDPPPDAKAVVAAAQAFAERARSRINGRAA